jgi:predicted nucleic acid-binding protein
MKSCVVDASVIAAAFFQEQEADQAGKIVTGGATLWAPDLIYAELANVIWKRLGRNEINAGEAEQLLGDFLNLPLNVAPSEGLARVALRLAIQTRRTVYDCLYLALAVREKTVMVTGDRRLVNALAGGPLDSHVIWVGDVGR